MAHSHTLSLFSRYLDKFGNYYGTGYPCVNIEGVIPGTSSTHAVDESTGQGVQVVVSSDYGADQIMKFCDSDNYAVSHYQATECHGERFATIVQPKTCTHCQTLRCISPKFMLRYIDFNMAQSWFDLTYIGYNAQTNSDVPMDYFDCQDHNGASVDGVTTLQDCYAKSSSNSIVYIGPDSDVNANYHSVKLVNLQFDGIYTQ